MNMETRNCPWCGNTADKSEEKKLASDSWKLAYVCRNCKKRHIVVVHEKEVKRVAEIERLEIIEQRIEEGHSIAEIGDELQMHPSRIGQILRGY